MDCPARPNPQRRDHSQQAARATARTKSDHPAAGAKNSIPRRTTRMATAVMTRVRSMEAPGASAPLARLRDRGVGRELLAGAAEAPLALPVGGEGILEGL